MLGKTYMFAYSLESSTSAFLLCRINPAPVRSPESVHHYMLGPEQHTRVGRVLPLPLQPSLASSSSPRLSIKIKLNKAFTTYPRSADPRSHSLDLGITADQSPRTSQPKILWSRTERGSISGGVCTVAPRAPQVVREKKPQYHMASGGEVARRRCFQ